MAERNIRTLRHRAVLCLVAWDKERTAVQPFVESHIHESDLSATDRHLALMIVQGVLRQLQTLDRILAEYSRHPLQKMRPLTLMTLRTALFQVIFLDRIPDSAAVNEAVKIMQRERQPRWIGSFVNGVLRSICRDKKHVSALVEGEVAGERVTNHPAWLVRRWESLFGTEMAGKICEANNHEPELALRTNTLQTDRETLRLLFSGQGREARPGSFAPDSLLIGAGGQVSSLPGYSEGLFHVQDEGAQLISLLLGPFEGKCLDACAGLGGKTCHLAQLFPEETVIIALEPEKVRFRRLGENVTRMGLEARVHPENSSVGDFARREQRLFNRILVDAPCSGTGVIRRHPDIRWNRKPEDMTFFQKQQVQILQQCTKLLAPGGVLVYATCSMEREENEEVIALFLEKNEQFALTDARQQLPESACSLVSREGYLSTTPLDGVDGFFAARLVKLQQSG